MTYTDKAPQTLLGPTRSQPSDDAALNLAKLYQMLLRATLALFVKFARARGPKTRRALYLTVTLLLIVHGGTREEKRAFLQQLMAEHNKKMERLYARYRIWRQRKCWMWGGGFLAASLAVCPGACVSATDAQSFDALIPD